MATIMVLILDDIGLTWYEEEPFHFPRSQPPQTLIVDCMVGFTCDLHTLICLKSNLVCYSGYIALMLQWARHIGITEHSYGSEIPISRP